MGGWVGGCGEGEGVEGGREGGGEGGRVEEERGREVHSSSAASRSGHLNALRGEDECLPRGR